MTDRARLTRAQREELLWLADRPRQLAPIDFHYVYPGRYYHLFESAGWVTIGGHGSSAIHTFSTRWVQLTDAGREEAERQR